MHQFSSYILFPNMDHVTCVLWGIRIFGKTKIRKYARDQDEIWNKKFSGVFIHTT